MEDDPGVLMHACRDGGLVPVATGTNVEESGGCREAGGEVTTQRSGFTHIPRHLTERKLVLCVIMVLRLQTILFSSRAILFDILSS